MLGTEALLRELRAHAEALMTNEERRPLVKELVAGIEARRDGRWTVTYRFGPLSDSNAQDDA